jgi:hypothetical protein
MNLLEKIDTSFYPVVRASALRPRGPSIFGWSLFTLSGPAIPMFPRKEKNLTDTLPIAVHRRTSPRAPPPHHPAAPPPFATSLPTPPPHVPPSFLLAHATPTHRVPPLLPLLPTAVTLPSPPPPLRILPSRDPPHDVCGRVLACVRYHMISSSPVAVAISYDSTAARTIPQSPVAAVISRGRHRLRFPWTQPSSLPVDAASAV